MQHLIIEATNRIRQMEAIFDQLQTAADKNPAAFREDSSVRDSLQILKRYYEGGQWLQDYALDEQGLLPPELKRGVLSQDAVYDFLGGIAPTTTQEQQKGNLPCFVI